MTAVAVAPPGALLPDRAAADWSRRLRSPTLIAWTSVSLAAAVVLIVILRGDPASETRTEAPGAATKSEVNPPPVAPSGTTTDVPSPIASDPPIDVPMAVDVPDPAVEPITPVVASDPADLEPIDVPIAEDVVRFDVATQLRQPILEFTQDKPVEVRKLLIQVAELSAVPIDASAVEVDPWRERLERPVTLALKETSVGGILAAVVEQAELRTEIVEGVIRVLPPEAAAPPVGPR